MSIYGTYFGFSLPLRTLAALVASRPRVWPLASTTYHLRSMFLPLGTKVDIFLLPLTLPDRAHSRPRNTSRKARDPMPNARVETAPTRQTNLVRVRIARVKPGLRGSPSAGSWLY